jgi:hypothetical protein
VMKRRLVNDRNLDCDEIAHIALVLPLREPDALHQVAVGELLLKT